jgi:hypothetical protein
MAEDDRLYQIAGLLREYSARPPLKFPSEAEIPKLAKRILDSATVPTGLWTKWDKDREEIARRAADLWVPPDDLLMALNRLPGTPLTSTDVEQRVSAIRTEYGSYPGEPAKELKDASYAAFEEEKAKGTEFIAILGWLEEWTWGADQLLRKKQEADWRERREQEKKRVEARLRSGADCPWSAAPAIADLHCRKNGRLFRLKPLEKGGSPLTPKFEVLEVKSLEDKKGVRIGHYLSRAEASKAVLEVAYNPDWR